MQVESARAHNGVSQTDAYQGYAYGREYDCPLVVLLYPQVGALAPRVARYRHRPDDEASPRFEIRTVDVRAGKRGAFELPTDLMDILAASLPNR